MFFCCCLCIHDCSVKGCRDEIQKATHQYPSYPLHDPLCNRGLDRMFKNDKDSVGRMQLSQIACTIECLEIRKKKVSDMLLH